jgi:2-C-methyl-D-erythritol 4-phosphate cytidylyltransferase
MQEKAAVVIVAAGSSRRMEGRDKLWMPLLGRLILARAIDVFETSPLISTIVLVLKPEQIADAQVLCSHEGWQKIGGIAPGGGRRQDSVRAGLDKLADLAPETRWVMIHDGARPLVTAEILSAGLKAAQSNQAAVAAMPVKDTIKQARAGMIVATPDRSDLWIVQTPQVFAFSLIHQAYHRAPERVEFTDDAALLEQQGHTVALFPGSYTNLKITTSEDLLVAEALIKGSFSL